MKFVKTYAIIMSLALIAPAVAESTRTTGEKPVQFFKTSRLFVRGFCEFEPSLSANWKQIASDQVKVFDMKQPSLKDLKEHAVEFGPGSSFYYYFRVPAKQYGMQDVLDRHYYFVSDNSARNIVVKIQGTIVYDNFGSLPLRRLYGTAVFECQDNEKIGFVLRSDWALELRAKAPTAQMIKTFEASSSECAKKYRSGQIIDIPNFGVSYFVARYEYINDKCKDLCEYIDLIRISGDKMTLEDTVGLCDV